MSQTFTTKQKFWGFVHGIVMALAYTSFFWLDWRIMTVFVILYYLQLKIFGGCLLTRAQFGHFDATFTGYYLDKLLIKFDIHAAPKKMKLFLDLLAPAFIILAAILQIGFKIKPLI